MKKAIAVAMGVLILTAVNLSAAGYYRVTVKLQEFSRPDGKAIDLREVMSDPGALAKLTAGETRFLHRTKLPAEGATEEEVQIGKTEARVSYTMGKEKDGKISVSVSVELTETMAVKDGVPINSTWSANTTMDCLIGQEMYFGGGAAGGKNGISLFTVLVAK